MLAFFSSLDSHVLHTLFGLRTLHATVAFIWVSELGSAITIIGLSVALALYLALKRKFALAQAALLVVAGSGIATFLIKNVVARARPPASFWAYTEEGYSFPSAHAALSLAFYGFLAFVIVRGDASPLWRRGALLTAGILSLLIGFSRLYLGVHYLSDVLGGYLLGAVALFLTIKTVQWLEGR